MSRTRLYWTCQILGWGAVFGGLFVLAVLGGTTAPASRSAMAQTLGLSYALALVSTHALRAVIVRRGWLDRPLAPLAARLIVGSLAASVLTTVVQKLYGWGGTSPTEPLDWGMLLNGVVTLATLYLAWAVVYALAVNGFRLGDTERDKLRLRASLAEARASLAEARLTALERQLDPHFLFNALNTVRALIAEDPAEARRAVSLLSGMLRRSLTPTQAPTHPLADELGLVQTYLALESLRFGDRLRIHVEASPEARTASVPPLLVQTLVENGVKHGVARCRAGGEVRVVAEVSDGRLTIEVTSPDAPPRRGRPQAHSSQEDPTDPPLGTGTGLRNARERLALLFGDQAELTLTLGDPTIARVTLPAHNSDAPHA